MPDMKKDEMHDLLNKIRENANEDQKEEQSGRKWSRDDIDRLLEMTARRKEDISSIDLSDTTQKSVADAQNNTPVYKKSAVHTTASNKASIDISKPQESSNADSRLKSIMNESEPKEKGHDFSSGFKKVRKKMSDLFSVSSHGSNDEFDTDEDEKRFLLSSDEIGTDEDDDMVIDYPKEKTESFDINKTKQIEKVTNMNPEKTQEVKVYIEKPGIVIKKGEAHKEDDLEGAPIIMSADDALKEKEISKIDADEPEASGGNEFQSRFEETPMDGQMVIDGFESVGETPEKVDETEAEQALFEKRREKINKFTLFGEDENGDPYGLEEESEKIGELFFSPEEKPVKKTNEDFIGIEYTQTKDSRRVMRYLVMQRKRTTHKLITLGILIGLSLAIGIGAASNMTASGDRILTIFSNMIILAIGLVVSNQTIVNSFEQLKKKKANINFAISFAAIVCFFQNLLMMVMYFLDKNTVSVFSSAGVVLLFISELNNYIMYSRAIDAMRMCTGKNKDKLYSIEGISDDKDSLELGKYVKYSSHRIRFSCKTRFPSHLIELCMSETSADKMIRIMFPVIIIMGLITLGVAWAVQGDFAVGFAAFSITVSLCVPAYGAMLIQLPLRWINKRFNNNGGMISCQESVEELCKTNAIILDSKELFDQNDCAMLGFKDFKSVRLDDAMLYAAAMVIRSGGPLTGVFDQMVINRRDILPTVKSFNYEEKLGVSGWIYGQKVVLGNRSMMVNHNVTVPQSVDEDKYLINGHEVIYLAIAHKLAAMIVVDYAPNKQIMPYLKKLRDSGVAILVRNCDPNVTEKMISGCYDMRLDNIKIINSAAGRVFKKYKSRPKIAARAVAIHDGSTYAFASTLCTASSLRHTFKIANMLTIVGMVMGFAIVLTLSVLNVIENLPAIFIILMQIAVALAFSGVMKIINSK